MIYLDSIGSIVNKVGTMYPAMRSIDGPKPVLEDGINISSTDLNCEVFKHLSWSDKHFLRKFVGDDLFKKMEHNSKTNSINDNFVWTMEDEVESRLAEAMGEM